MQEVLTVTVITILFVGCYLINYVNFYACLSDDVEFNYGKHKKRDIRKKTRGFWKKFFFADIRNLVEKWHYILFIINFIAFIPMLISVNIYVLSNEEAFLWIFLVSGGAFVLSSVPIVFARWSLYKGNIVRSREKYRKNNRK